MYVIIEALGKQYKVEQGQTFVIDQVTAEKGALLQFPVLLVADESGISVGKPYIEGARVDCEVVRHDLGQKIIIFKHKRRKGYRKKQGHRQKYTEVMTKQITFKK